MEMNPEDSSLSGAQLAQLAKLAAVVENARDALLAPYREPDDSGIDSDDPVLPPSADCSTCSDGEYSDTPCPVHEMNTLAVASEDTAPTQRDSLDIFVQWLPGQCPESCESLDRSSPPLYEVELTASDEDDDASVLELVIPMQSRYQRVPTSSPKKTKKKPSLLAKLFCCSRK